MRPSETVVKKTGPGFYKKDGDQLLFAPNAVTAPDYKLLKERKGLYKYPKDGWTWFESEDEARAALNIPVEEK